MLRTHVWNLTDQTNLSDPKKEPSSRLGLLSLVFSSTNEDRGRGEVRTLLLLQWICSGVYREPRAILGVADPLVNKTDLSTAFKELYLLVEEERQHGNASWVGW